MLNVSGETVLRLAKCFAHLGFGFGHSETGETSKTKMSRAHSLIAFTARCLSVLIETFGGQLLAKCV
ncbi:unnamed protein product [Rhizophagus irregularis]|uniref:Uncharacterized protein n=1 Tax=Rhizophagus irregularis TaxID=588596 RepID=A0A915ZU90_9GLOM|nr:unnamed protein product [Rhizophagus irregularis]CAB5204323.1 unnamed protein product [Rhizophagus irregularis]CAB5387398.1 unnamed protein product [Rhizophagus irregularis]